MDESHKKTNKPPKKPKLKTSFLQRSLSTAKLTTRLGIGTARKLLNQEITDPEQAVKVAVKLANEFDGMKGLMMKFGQMASYLGTHMPVEAREALATLQSSSTAMEFSTVKNIIETEFIQPLEQLFEDFEQEAFAAASIGQVHRAKVNGKAVAVKVQYPDIERLISLDLSLVGNLFSMLALGSSMPGKEMAQELKQRILEECDYHLEAEHQITIGKLCETIPDENVPIVVESHSCKKVLTSQYVEALDFKTFCEQADQETKNKAAVAIFKHTFNAIFKYCYFNGDPHPGNYLFHEDGSVTFLDFGCIKKFDSEFIILWKAMAKSILEQNKPANLKASIDLGLIGNVKKFDHDFHWQAVNHVYEPFMSDTPFSYTESYNAKTNDLMLWSNQNKFSTRMPADFLFINRLQWGLAAVLADLNATAIWKPYFHEAVYAEPTPIFR
ncbi:MAG: AarF/ABC1/UbiB kinase family protein [Enterobacterales bacterium]|nr:AarF/ABC1/UbiB kinase family protein [Enterobacterales bacterium]